MVELNDDYRVRPPQPQTGVAPLPLPHLDSGSSDLLSEHIARIESLKIKILRLAGLSESERNGIFQDLDILRGALLQGSSGMRATPAVPSDSRRTQNRNRSERELKMEGILGQSPRIQKLLRIISKIASTDLTVLMEGETGSGKELFARIIHNNSARTHFVAINCGAFPSGLIESELFGHVKGAFTGATHERKGKFEEANGGTIFLDEIGELEMSAQVKILRALQEGELQRVGSDATYKTNVRVIAATNRNLAEMVERGQFREDLYYRINMCPLLIPPLRERRDEIRILLEYFFQEVLVTMPGKEPVLDRALQQFIYEQYDFPGNIRELKNLAYFLAHMIGDRPLGIEDLPERYQRAVNRLEPGIVPTSMLEDARGRAEKTALVDVLSRHGGRIRPVCAELAISRSRLYQLLKKFNLKPVEFRGNSQGTSAAEIG